MRRIRLPPDDIEELTQFHDEIISYFPEEKLKEVCEDVMCFCLNAVQSVQEISEVTETNQEFDEDLCQTICLYFLKLYIDQKKFFFLIKNLELKYKDICLHVTQNDNNKN